MVIKMICKYCGKNISGLLLICNKCREKHKNMKSTCISNNIDYIQYILASTDIDSVQKKDDHCAVGTSPCIRTMDKNDTANFMDRSSEPECRNKNHPFCKILRTTLQSILKSFHLRNIP